MTATSNRWADLRPRLLSAIVMVAVGAVEIWLGGPTFAALVVVLTAVMVWELAGMTAPWRLASPVMLGAASGVALAVALFVPHALAWGVLVLPVLAMAATPRRDRGLATVYVALILVAGHGLVTLRDGLGGLGILWLVAVVIASDVLGYFAGRIIGGPKFWERISPKKTWSGTIAGWLGAALVAAGFVLAGQGGWLLVPVSALVAFAGQMGDILESWIKRRAGVKDASAIIPGHGGLLDRFDALIVAVVAVEVLSLLGPLPLGAALGT